MKSRMDKYQIDVDKKFKRTTKNTELYDEVYDDMYRDTTYQNMRVIDSAKEININKLKNILDDKYDTRQYRTIKNYSTLDDDFDELKELKSRSRKSYDINEIIDDAKSKRTFIEEAKEKQKFLEFKERNTKYNEMEKEEKELEELINTMTMAKIDDKTGLFDNLKGSDNTIVTKPISSDLDNTKTSNNLDTKTEDNLEKTLIKADKTFYTDSNMFTKNDFEDFGDLSKELNKKGNAGKIIIIILIILILVLSAYFVVTNYIIK